MGVFTLVTWVLDIWFSVLKGFFTSFLLAELHLASIKKEYSSQNDQPVFIRHHLFVPDSKKIKT